MTVTEVTAMRDNTKATLKSAASESAATTDPGTAQLLATWTTNLLLCELWLKIHKQWGGE